MAARKVKTPEKRGSISKKKIQKAVRAVRAARPTSTDVSIKHVSNGYVISQWTNGKEKAMIAKTKAEAKTIATQFMGLV